MRVVKREPGLTSFYFFKVCTSGGIRRLQEGFKGREFALQIRQFVREFTARVELGETTLWLCTCGRHSSSNEEKGLGARQHT